MMTLSKSILLVPLFIMAAVGYVLAAEMLEGNASYYSDKLDGNKTASGEIYNKDKMTAAHRTLPFGTTIKVTYLKTGKSVEVVINDRGPHARDRIIDLSGAAAKKVGMIDDGQGKVKLEIYD